MINAEAQISAIERPVAILMGTYNGAKYLDEQLASLAGQTFRNWSLHVSDDGSVDTTCDIVRRFAATVPQPVALRPGPRTGFVDNFLSLARDEAIEADFFAFCDQDDIWYPEKLMRALTWFASLQDDTTPAVYFSRTELVDRDGRHLGFSAAFRRPPDFRNALVQSIGGANTAVFNRAARGLLRATEGVGAVSHDWALYLLVSAVGGVVHYDERPTLRYRQHGGNVMGSNRGLRAISKRLELALGGTLGDWNARNLRLLAPIGDRLTAANRTTLSHFSEARTAGPTLRLLKLRTSGVYRQGPLGTLGLAVAALMGKL